MPKTRQELLRTDTLMSCRAMSTTISAPARVTPRSAWPRRLFFVGFAVLALVWAIPIILSHSPFVGWVEDQLRASTGCRLRIGGLSLGWFRPVAAYNVQLCNAADQPLLTASSIESQRTLLGLLLNTDRPGGFRIERATLQIVFSGKESNLDEALTQIIDAPATKAAVTARVVALPPMEIELVDSCLKWTDRGTGQSWQLAPVQASVRLFHDEATPLHARLVGSLGDAANPGSVEASVAIHADAGVWTHGEAKARLQSVPLGMAVPLVHQVVPDANLTGAVQGQCLLTWAMDQGTVTDMTLDGDFTAKSCTALWPNLAERLVLDYVRAPCKLHFDGTRLIVSNAEVTCDLGHARYHGAIDLRASGLTWLDRPGHDLTASLDLVRLTDRLPKTLRLHPDLRVTSGQVRLDAKSGASESGDGWEARLNVTNITGVRGNQPIIWQDPVVLDCRARQIGYGVPIVEEIRCSSGFLTMDGATTAEGFRFQGDADLGKLADPLSRFVDFGSARIAGQAHGELTVRSTPGRRFSVNGHARIADLFIEWLKGRPLEEDVVLVQLSAEGRIDRDGLQRVDTASVITEIAGDRVQADLAEVLADLSGPEWGIWQVRLEGDLGRWQRRLRSGSAGLDRWQLGGSVVAQGQMRHGGKGVECPALAVTARDFHVSGPGVQVNEPTLYFHSAAGLDNEGTLQLRDVQLRCPSLSATALRVRWVPGTADVRGSLRIRGDLARLKLWLPGEHEAHQLPIMGELDGLIDLRPVGDDLDFNVQVATSDLAWGDYVLPHSATIKVTGRGRLEPGEDRLLLGPLQVNGPFGTFDAQGAVSSLATRCSVDLTGDLHYDLALFEPLLAPALGNDLRIEGKDTRAFALSGPLFPEVRGAGMSFHLRPSAAAHIPLQLRDLHGEAAVAWQTVNALGCDVGPAELKFRLHQGWLQLHPLVATLNGGQLRLQPNLRLDPGPAELVLLAGPVLERARITPEMCAGALGHAVPALGHVAEVSGTASLTLDGARVPLADPNHADIRGKLVLHGARVGAGPLTRELSSVLKTKAPTCVIREAEIPVQLVNGRIYHRDLELGFAEFNVRTSGSVGLDGSLMLLAELPIPTKLLGVAQLPPQLARQTIRVPITGTVDQPRVDQRALQAVSSQLIRDLASDALKHELEHKLKGLLKPGGGQ
jgi:hypothetical protein